MTPGNEIDVLRSWARGDFYPLTSDEQGRDAVDELANMMAMRPKPWWQAFQTVFAESDKTAKKNLAAPLEALLHVGGEPLWNEVAVVAHHDGRIANAFWHAMYLSQLGNEAYKRLGRQMTVDAFVRHKPRIPSKPGPPRPEESGDEWSGDVLLYLTREDPEEAWTLCLELLAVSADPGWAATIGAFIVEDLLHDRGDVFIDRIEAEAAKNERLRMALPTARWRVPEHLMARVMAAAGPYWDEKF